MASRKEKDDVGERSLDRKQAERQKTVPVDRPIRGPTYLGSLARPAVGIRIPEILLNGILEACKKRNVAIGFSLSFGRETAPEYVINAAPGKYPIVMGHTGTSITKYALMAAQAAREKGVPVEIEAGHVMIAGSAAEAV